MLSKSAEFRYCEYIVSVSTKKFGRTKPVLRIESRVSKKESGEILEILTFDVGFICCSIAMKLKSIEKKLILDPRGLTFFL